MNDIDLKADDIIMQHLKKSGVVYQAMSEENPKVSIHRVIMSIVQ